MVVDQQRRSDQSSSQSDTLQTFWSDVDSIRNEKATFNQGKLVKINHWSILGALLLCKAKLFCLKHMPSTALNNSVQYLCKVLAELDQTDLAVSLALANDISPSFAIASKLDKLKN